ncbi:MAG: hypothetical protein WAS07_08925 [Micropruina sp.]
MSELIVRAYNVSFGDAILVSIPEGRPGRETVRHLLIDVGNVLANADKVLVDAVREISEITGGEVDLYLMTHEHLDHVQGLLAAERAGVPLKARYAWFTGSADPTYYDTHLEARKQKRSALTALDDAHRIAQAEDDEWLAMMVRNNSPSLPVGAHGLTTGDYIDHLRQIAPANRTFYVDRTTGLRRKHPFREARLTVLAPEEDTADYYRRATGLAFTVAEEAEPGQAKRKRTGEAPRPIPPPGVDPGAFFDLVNSRRRSLRQSILAIDKAANDTSLVLLLEWRGWRLLFLGDAEERSWGMMHSHGLLAPVHLVKVSHHGSHNGTEDSLLDQVMPPTSHDGRERHALVSTHDGDWDSVPDTDTLGAFSSRCTLHDTRTAEPGKPVEIRFPG